MESCDINYPEYEQIGSFKVHRTTLLSITGWRPHYWMFLTFETRQVIDKSVIQAFHRSLQRHSVNDVDEYDEAYQQWIIHQAASAARNQYWRECLYQRDKREQDIQHAKRVNCGARKKTGEQCKAKAEYGRNRCRFHGGKSTGPKTIDGKIKSLAGLPQYQHNPQLLIKKRKELELQMREETGF